MSLIFYFASAFILPLLAEGGSKQDPLTPLEDQGPRLNVQNQTKVPLRFPCDNVTRICAGEFTECRRSFCHCLEGYSPRWDNSDLCGERVYYNTDIQTDPTMIGVVVGLVLMSITLCVVMRLFAKARFRENRTIFNTPNPRLMNVSLMKSSKQFFRGNSASGRRDSQTEENSPVAETPPPTSQLTSFPLSEDVPRAPGGGGRGKIFRQQSSETTGGSVETPTAGSSSGGGGTAPPRFPKGKYRQDSVNSNSNV